MQRQDLPAIEEHINHRILGVPLPPPPSGLEKKLEETLIRVNLKDRIPDFVEEEITTCDLARMIFHRGGLVPLPPSKLAMKAGTYALLAQALEKK